MQSNAKDSDKAGKLKCLLRLLALGYNGVVWNHSTFGGVTAANTRKKFKEVRPEDRQLRVASAQLALVESKRKTTPEKKIDDIESFKQYNRLTVTVDEPIDAQTLTAGNDQC